jgi:hypothetical protein
MRRRLLNKRADRRNRIIVGTFIYARQRVVKNGVEAANSGVGRWSITTDS